jgi:hypothetical protein
MDKNDDRRQQLLLDMTASKSATSPSGPGELLEPWLRLSRHLSPLIGESGLCALYSRSVRLVMPRFAWLSPNPSPKSIPGLIATLQENLVSVDMAVASEANAALLHTFTKLLSALIGDALTTRILNSAWTGEHEQKNAEEHK